MTTYSHFLMHEKSLAGSVRVLLRRITVRHRVGVGIGIGIGIPEQSIAIAAFG